EDVFNAHRLDKAADYIREDYYQHNPQVQQGLSGFVGFFTMMFERAPGFRQEILHMVAEDDLVVVHARARGIVPGKYNKVVDIYRLEGGKLAEHWDVLERDIADEA
ncbi:MAG: ester cyclase, partial [Clostridia bacterium]|nr:ester cyclase [Clostridia bacterium]